MIKNIFGIDFNEMLGGLIALDASLMILPTQEIEQSFQLRDFDVKKLPKFFEKFNCTSFSINITKSSQQLNFDDILFGEKITQLSFDFSEPVEIIYRKNVSYFPNLQILRLDGVSGPVNCPDFRDFKKLRHVNICYYAPKFSGIWSNLDQVTDLHLQDFGEADLSILKKMISLRRLRLTGGKIKSLDGLEALPKLETLLVESTRRLKNVDAIMHSSTLKNIMFRKYISIHDWSFLAKKSFECISLDTADSVDFMMNFPDLKYFSCETVKDRNKKSILYSTMHDQEKMKREGIQVKYVPSADIFFTKHMD